jgi:hypothetical protein
LDTSATANLQLTLMTSRFRLLIDTCGTGRGHFGLAWQDIKAGDRVCLIDAAPRHFILRQEQNYDVHWSFPSDASIYESALLTAMQHKEVEKLWIM